MDLVLSLISCFSFNRSLAIVFELLRLGVLFFSVYCACCIRLMFSSYSYTLSLHILDLKKLERFRFALVCLYWISQSLKLNISGPAVLILCFCCSQIPLLLDRSFRRNFTTIRTIPIATIFRRYFIWIVAWTWIFRTTPAAAACLCSNDCTCV